MQIFNEISLLLLITFVVSAFLYILKQPLIISYILTGVIAGPHILNILRSTETVELFSKLGITALLFIVGLGLSPKIIKELGVISLIVGISQIVVTSVLVFLISLLLGFDRITSMYVALALTFSSTIIILKLLTDKGDVSKLYGRLSIGFLLVQDLVATVALLVIASLANINSGTKVYLNIGFLLLKGLILLVVLFCITTYILPKLNKFIARSQEFLFVASLAWGIGISALYFYLGLSIEIGALVAGVTLSMVPYAHEISSRFKPLRDFFIILFFILLGYQMSFDNWRNVIIPVTVFTLFIFFIKPIIIFMITNLLGYSKRTAFFTGAVSSQISEFSLILLALGYSAGHLSKDIMSIITLVGIITISGSSYIILYSEKLFKFNRHILKFFEIRKKPNKVEHDNEKYDAILFGYRRVGAEFADAFSKMGNSFLAVDFNPDTIAKLEKSGVPCIYGDAEDIELLQELPLKSVKIAVSTIPDFDTNMLIVQTIKAINSEIITVIISDTLEQADKLYQAGATHVIMPHYIGAHFAAEMLVENMHDKFKHEESRKKHLDYLKKLKEISLEVRI